MPEGQKINFMQIALDCAKTAAQLGEVPVGAVIVHQGQVIATTHNRVETQCDPTAHAEILAIQKAAALMREPRLPECDLYVTLEPCPMCAQAISFARLKNVYFGAYDPKGGGIDHGPRIFDHKTAMHKPHITGGFEETQCAALLKSFFQDLRNGDNLSKNTASPHETI